MSDLRYNELSKEIKKISKRCCCVSGSIENGCCYEEITLTEAQYKVTNSQLVPNKMYKITGVHKNKILPAFEILYDDGTNSGTTIYLRALTNTKFEIEGYGEFYNPKYSQEDYGTDSVPGTVVASSGSTYTTDTAVTTTGGSGTGMTVDIIANTPDGWVLNVVINDPGTGYVAGDVITIDGGDNSATFTYSEGLYLYNIWDGDNPDPNAIPGYNVGDVVYWGGYAWTNVRGGTGTADDILTLNSEDWTKVPYSNTTHYNKVLDEIEYDYANDWIQRRTSGTIDIFFPYTYWNSSENNWSALSGSFSVDIHGISACQWGNVLREDGDGVWGVGLILANDAYIECINFKGKIMLGVTANHYSSIYSIYYGYNSQLRDILLDNRSYIKGNTFLNGGIINDWRLLNQSWQDKVSVRGASIVSNLTQNSSWIQAGEEDYAIIQGDSSVTENSLDNGSYWTDILIEDSSISSCSWNNGSYISGSFDNSELKFSSFNNITYTSVLLVDTIKELLRFDSYTGSITGASNITESGAYYNSNEIVLNFKISFNGSAGRGLVGALNVPDVELPVGWYIDTVIVSHNSALTGGVGSYVTLGLATDDVDSGLTSVTGLVTTINGANVIKYSSLVNTVTTDIRKIVGATGANNVTAGNLYFQVIIKKAYES